MDVIAETVPTRRATPTLETLSPGQIAAIRSIPAHDKAVPKPIDAHRPASIFLDDARHALEQRSVFRRLPVPVIPSAMLPEPGSVIAHDGYGVPLLLSRAKDGTVRAFLNACRHKGSKLIDGCEPRKAGRLSCPYHAWTYALDGRLIGVPREETFLNFSKDARPLVALPCRESAGIVWVVLDRTVEPDFSGLTPELDEDMAALGIPSAHVYGRRTFHLKANWKLVLEPFLEGYHVQRLHAQSIGNMFADSPNATHHLGPHMRQVSGKAHYTPDMVDQPGENIHKIITHAYLLFPSTVVVTSPYYISVMIIMPKSATESQVDYYMLTPGPADNAKAEDLYARSYELILKVFGTEDFWAAEITQAGLSSGALDEVVYSGLEAAIPEFYDNLDRHLR